MEFRIGNINTVMPGEIREYDASTQTATVRPLTKRVEKDPEGNTLVEPYPDIYGVPVVQPRNSDYFVSFPLGSGDPVLLCSAKHDIESWFEDGGLSEPETTRKHALTDCFAVVGGLSRGAAEGTQTPSENGMVMGKADDDGQIFMSSDEISLGGEGSGNTASIDEKVQAELDKIKAELDALAVTVNLINTMTQAHQHAYILPLIPLPGPQPAPTTPGTPADYPVLQPLAPVHLTTYVKGDTASELVKIKK
jgi:hypothetical protein